jgi:ornithine carbamoyltransferase
MCRTFSHEMIEELAGFAGIPIINGLTDRLHPCQALADYMTLQQVRGDLQGCKLTYVGDGNNVACSLMNGGARLGVHVTVVTPPGFEPDAGLVTAARAAAVESGSKIELSNDLAAVEGADAIYTDVWASMGQEDETEERAAIFNDFRVDEEMMALAKPDAVFMHCLPAHRGQEVTSGVIDSPASIVFDIAENRLHVQKAILALLLGKT